MRSVEVLEMINKGQIEELKGKLQDEIYTESLKNKPGVKARYSAMKKYFTYRNTRREILQKPCAVNFEGLDYISFCNSYSLALTTESVGEIEMYDESHGAYPNVGSLIRRDGLPKTVDLNKVIAEAKSKGYKLKKSEVNGTPTKYLMYYGGAYFRLGLVDATYEIINDGKPATVYQGETKRASIVIENELGVCLVLPINITDEAVEEDGYVVIEVEEL